MAYNVNLDARLQEALSGKTIVRKKMFGGICYLFRGNLMCGVYKDYLILRVGEEEGEAALKRTHVKPFDITGHAMKGWVMVEEAGLKGAALGAWLKRARAFSGSLPAKK